MNKILLLMLLILAAQLGNAQRFFLEEFADSIPSDWQAIEVVGNNTFNSNWVHTYSGPMGQASIGPINSRSKLNGWMLFDSFTNGSGDQDVRLVSPPINCTNRVNVFLQFQTYYERYYDTVYLEVKQNDVWTSINLFPELVLNQFSDGTFVLTDSLDIVVRNLSEYADGNPNFQFAFRFIANESTAVPEALPGDIGRAYSWQIDDVELWENDPRPLYDLRISQDFFAIAPNAVTPISQMEELGFLADIENAGAEQQDSVNLNVSILKNNEGEPVYSEDLFYGTIPTDSIIENQLFDSSGFFPPAEVAFYEGIYTVSSNRVDEQPIDNSKKFYFSISDSIFAKETGPTSTLRPPINNWPNGEPTAMAIGNYFYMPNGAGHYARKASFAITDAFNISGRVLELKLYEWEDSNEDKLVSPSERNLIGSANYLVTGSEFDNQLITVDLESSSAVEIFLADDTHYLLMIEYQPDDQRILHIPVSNEYDYRAMTLRSDSLAIKNNIPQRIRYSYFSAADSPINDAVYFPEGFGHDRVPVIRLHISAITSSLQNPTLLDEANKFTVSPNPITKGQSIFTAFDLTRHSKNVRIQLIDINGKIWAEKSWQEVRVAQHHFDISTLINGMYFLKLLTDQGIRTEKMVIQK